mmetsp:Transcript_15134/g.23026  ORF Transcript_15134/g.23026 Transcript_15134/m.23026 type:complete len:604 (+) Transcript_15134:215-2026(+)|eukprot:CAMPEP_0118702198 /NCGR_PEP_ID=MMETSP0800-20121206/17736_1 /TAXON_ID=210618 ORGANISM="Striatella unipunctata, Strain CCMP2910" /NCGR_SAMPLE_ID=MMETSP0800 /ASSEMBLY_ACC=CAM_ASM_000638 /LENGTH=603 /DNA_ID=CAMNT_0006603329 /DNA_START=154 /DNA_END=1965 /DNA_ORIENTATION=-
MCKPDTVDTPSTNQEASIATSTKSPYSLTGIFLTKDAYKQVGDEFHPYHQHDLNALLHLLTTGVGMWGAVQLAVLYNCEHIVWAYSTLVCLTVPLLTGVIHTAAVLAMAMNPITVAGVGGLYACIGAIVAGYGLQDVAHWACDEKTYLGAYIYTRPYMLIIHTLWLLPLVIDSILMRHCFLPWVVSRKRAFHVTADSKKEVDQLQTWINTNVAEVAETTHLWPHERPETSKPFKTLESDKGLYAGFRSIFAEKHFDIRPVVGMNEIYVTAVGAKKPISSDAVFYTPHVDGPWWFLPGASLYRVLVGLTPNTMVVTRFNLQYPTYDTTNDKYECLGFDYNRELHWIENSGPTNKERRSVIKLHYVVYPKGWHTYGAFCAFCNQAYNTWARNNFLRTLRPDDMFTKLNAWWIWVTTFSMYKFEENIGTYNAVYFTLAYLSGPTAFLILTSFRHYVTYIATFAYRKPTVAHGYFMRDVRLCKTVALVQLAIRIAPFILTTETLTDPYKIAGIISSLCGFAITMLATVRLGWVRTYFGSELGFVKPEWIYGFPYGYVPHPMIVGQLIAFGSILAAFPSMSLVCQALIGTHMTFYTIHMLQEIYLGSY